MSSGDARSPGFFWQEGKGEFYTSHRETIGRLSDPDAERPSVNDNVKIVYWHRELPPLDAELMAEHTIEATSGRVAGTISHRDELWDRCYTELMANIQTRLTQEIARLGGHYAHVHSESIDTRHDDAAGEAWLHGRFSYMLYCRPSQSP
jgi:hypothetical protein